MLMISLSKVGMGQSFTLANNSFDVNASPINFNCSSVTFDCVNPTSNSLTLTVYSSSSGLAGSYNIIFSATISANTSTPYTFYNLGINYYYAELSTTPLYTSTIYRVDVRSKPSAPTITSNSPICEGTTLALNAANVTGGTFS